MQKRNFFFNRSTVLLTIIFVVAASLIFFMMALTYKHLENQTDGYGKITDSYEVSLKLETIYSNLKDVETERRNYILQNTEQSREESKKTIDDKIDENKLLLKNLDQFFVNDEDRKKNLRSLKLMMQYKYDIVNQTYNGTIDRKDENSVKNTLLIGKNVMASIHDKISEMLEIEHDSLDERKEDLLFLQRSTPIYFYIIGIFSLCLLIFAFYRINKDVKIQKRINKELNLTLNTSKLAESVGNFGIWVNDLSKGKFHFSDNFYGIQF